MQTVLDYIEETFEAVMVPPSAGKFVSKNFQRFSFNFNSSLFSIMVNLNSHLKNIFLIFRLADQSQSSQKF